MDQVKTKRSVLHVKKTWLKQPRLFRLPDVLMFAVADSLDAVSYLRLISTCERMYRLTESDILRANHAVDVARILRLVFEEKRNVYITGSAGCGKTFLINLIYRMCGKHNIDAVMTATTGIASTNLTDGRTVHSFSGLRKGTIPIKDLLPALQAGYIRPSAKNWGKDMLIIDEFSMNGARLLEKLDIVGKYARKISNLPLGGIQLIMSGDFFQLPPVGDKFAFTSHVWKALDPVVVTLRFPFRQSQDMSYYYMLQRIRLGEPNEQDYEFLEAKCAETNENSAAIDSMEIKPIRIYPKRKDVYAENERQFAMLDGEVQHDLNASDRVVKRTRIPDSNRFIYTDSSELSVAEALERLGDRAEYQAASNIKLKEGTLLIMTFNFNLAHHHVNGSQCIYKEGKVHFKNQTCMELKQTEHEFCYSIGDDLFLVRRQVALVYGWAISCHSSQGMTLEMAMIDLGPSVFTSGQAYVALSRVKNAKGLYINKFSRKSIKASKAALEFDE